MEAMNRIVELIATVLFVFPWLAGIVLANGFWSTLVAVCFFPYAWYLVVERAMQMTGWL